MKKCWILVVVLIATAISNQIGDAFGGTGIVKSGKVSSISQAHNEPTVKIIQIGDDEFFVDVNNVVTLGTVSPVNRYTFYLGVGDNVIVIAENQGLLYPTVRLIILMPSP